MKRSVFILTVATTIIFSSLVTSNNYNFIAAQSINELESEKSKLQKERSTINSNIKETEQKISELQTEQERIHKEIKRLNMSIADTNNKIREKNVEIASTESDIAKLKEEITILQERIVKRNEILKGRALSFQENGGVISYLDVLLGAQSFSDFIDRVTGVATLIEADRSILNEHNNDKQTLETTQNEVEQQLSSLQTMRSDLQSMEADLKSQKGEKDQLVAKLKEEELEAEDTKLSLEEEEQILAEQEKAVQMLIKAEKQRIKEEEEARRRAEEEARRQAEQAQNNQNDGNNSGNSNHEVQTPPVSSGAWTNPSGGRLTSYFRPPHRPNHHGIDIAGPGLIPIVAAADGVVFSSYYSSSYGNVVFIRHNINGQVYTTVYAHMRNRDVQSGTFVSKGQRLGYMGNTGRSSGQHLHFEVHRGDWNNSKTNAVNPLQFVNY